MDTSDETFTRYLRELKEKAPHPPEWLQSLRRPVNYQPDGIPGWLPVVLWLTVIVVGVVGLVVVGIWRGV